MTRERIAKQAAKVATLERQQSDAAVAGCPESAAMFHDAAEKARVELDAMWTAMWDAVPPFRGIR